MGKKRTKPVILPHFSAEEVAALEKEHERRETVFKGQGLFDNDTERIRDAMQRESFWRAQPASGHRDEELAHALFTEGRIDEALTLSKSFERRAYYESIQGAILRDDNEECECETPDHVIGHFPSAKHQGRMVPMRQCPECKGLNIR